MSGLTCIQLFVTLIITLVEFMKKCFENINFKKSADDKMHLKIPGMQSGNDVILLVLVDLIGVLITEDHLTHLYIVMLRSLSVVMLLHEFYLHVSAGILSFKWNIGTFLNILKVGTKPRRCVVFFLLQQMLFVKECSKIST